MQGDGNKLKMKKLAEIYLQSNQIQNDTRKKNRNKLLKYLYNSK